MLQTNNKLIEEIKNPNLSFSETAGVPITPPKSGFLSIIPLLDNVPSSQFGVIEGGGGVVLTTSISSSTKNAHFYDDNNNNKNRYHSKRFVF